MLGGFQYDLVQRSPRFAVFCKKLTGLVGLNVLFVYIFHCFNFSSAAGLKPTDPELFGYFSSSVSAFGTAGLVGAMHHDIGPNSSQGAVYLFRDLDTATGNVTENAKLVSSDGGLYSQFGVSVSLWSNMGLIGSNFHTVGPNAGQGAAYIFVDLDSVTGTVYEEAQLLASDGAEYDFFGHAVSLHGTTGLVGAYGADVGLNNEQGAAYLFRGLDSASGTVFENAKLIASDGDANDAFGYSVSLHNTIGVVGAHFANIGSNMQQGAAYVFRDLDVVTGIVYHDAKLISSDGNEGDNFGGSVSIYGNQALVGARGHDVGSNMQQGAAYLFRNLNSVSGTVTESVKLLASDGAEDDTFGIVALYGNTGIVGAPQHDFGLNNDQGAAYIFTNLHTASGTVTQNVKLVVSDGGTFDFFGNSVSLNDDLFIIGALFKDTGEGKAFSGYVRTFLTADLGNDSTQTDGLSFYSSDDWIIGATTSNNTVTLSSGDYGQVWAPTRGTYVGQNTSSNNNTLIISQNSTLETNFVEVGNGSNSGNEFNVNGDVTLFVSTGYVNVQPNNTLSGEGIISTGDVTISGILSPGNGGIGLLTVQFADVVWNYNNPWLFELGTPSMTLAAASTSDTTQDLLMISFGNFLKGLGSGFVFDFGGTGGAGWYKLVDWTGTTDFDASDFLAINLPASLSLAGFVVDGGTSALYVHIIPEPGIAVIVGILLVALMLFRFGSNKNKLRVATLENRGVVFGRSSNTFFSRR